VLPDLWTTCDLPVLTELVRLLEVAGRHQVELPLEVGALSRQQVEAALRRLYGAGYIDGVTIDQAAHPIIVTSVCHNALQAVGAWPSPEKLVDRLLDALADAAENAHSEEERSRARRALDALRAAGRDVLVNAAGGALGGMALG
jgi:hypothetical protein